LQSRRGIELENGEVDEKVFKRDNGHVHINAQELHYRELNAMVKQAATEGATEMEIDNVYGQRYIGSGVRKPVHIDIFGVPGNDLGAFMDGPEIVVHRNAQDGVGNTMNSGAIVVHGRAGDIVAMGMRGGNIYIKGSVGYRAAIHMKEYMKHKPVLVIGGTCQDFLGEYMAGGVVVVLGLDQDPRSGQPARHMGTGMHGGVIYVRGKVEPDQLGEGVSQVEMDDKDTGVVEDCVKSYCEYFGEDSKKIMKSDFTKLAATSNRPYGNLYAY
jgi:glutamate synthase domain-containing protein 3